MFLFTTIAHSWAHMCFHAETWQCSWCKDRKDKKWLIHPWTHENKVVIICLAHNIGNRTILFWSETGFVISLKVVTLWFGSRESAKHNQLTSRSSNKQCDVHLFTPIVNHSKFILQNVPKVSIQFLAKYLANLFILSLYYINIFFR